MSKTTVLAFDFGASSGRAIKACYDGKTLTYHEIHRFENNPYFYQDHFCWDIDELMQNVYTAIEKAGEFNSVGFDTWGVDYGLLDKNGNLVKRPVSYRDIRTRGVAKKAFEKMSAYDIYRKTGNQIMDMNTLFQLISDDLSGTEKILFMPDLFSYMLCKNAVCEQTIASTSQMFNPTDMHWQDEVLNTFGISQNKLCTIVPSGTIIGEYKNAKVIAVAGHDTQCAVAAMPCKSKNVAFLSCGTWSLFGTELDSPVLTKQSFDNCLSNEIGANSKINFLKNIIGLWLIQESRREWKRQGKEYSYAELEKLALEAQPLQCFINPDASEFATPGDIPSRVQKFCEKTGQKVPDTVGEIMRCIYESLAMKYRYALMQITNITQKNFTILHVLGGGTKDKLLCQMTANSCNITVEAGPIEATALGNIIIQLVALGKIPSIDEGRQIIANTEHIIKYYPTQSDVWEKAYNNCKKFFKEDL
ncbi:rhamnulokinase family protein [Paludicola sp. MB14-C6]|uniref:rhamnulokinase n=1 Tax=Paludihabitans sp. MB14-C6 TaxID=3070656 RepID=UPI0027DCDEE7|nr:rhamnulokinase family protein [Paludicola sp. MB14-C6]WMJ22637.1 rhamnulokinase family protein [Paludicola sp. MB14-C6]